MAIFFLQMGLSVKTSQSDRERPAGEALLKEAGYSRIWRQRPNCIMGSKVTHARALAMQTCKTESPTASAVI